MIIASWLLAGCMDPAEGTFVGNPSLTAYYASTPEQTARGGVLVAETVLLDTCGGSEEAVGPLALSFVDGRTGDALSVPAGDHCGLSFVAERFTVQFDTDDGLTTVRGRDLMVDLPVPFTVGRNTATPLLLGGDDWLADLAAVTGPGINDLDGGPIEAAFLGGLDATRAEEPITDPLYVPPTGIDPTGLSGTWSLADHPVAPGGQPTSTSPCPGQDQAIPFAVPIAPAVMASVGSVHPDVGWCEGSVLFTNDQSDRTVTLLDPTDGSTYEVVYNSVPGCPGDRCGRVRTGAGELTERWCEVLALCTEDAASALAVGHTW